MVNWCKIAGAILETEFPSFGLLAHLGTAVGISSKADLGANAIKSLKVLAKTWGVDKELLHYFVLWNSIPLSVLNYEGIPID